MEAEAIVILEAGNMDLPPNWVKPGAVVFSCDSTHNTGNVLLRVYVYSACCIYIYIINYS